MPTTHEFKTDDDRNFMIPSVADQARPALLFNPEAQPFAIAAAAASRANCLQASLYAWARTQDQSIAACDVASALEPLAREIELIIDHLVDRLSESARALAAGQ